MRVVINRESIGDHGWSESFEGSENAQHLSRREATRCAREMAEMYPCCSWGVIREDTKPSRWGISPSDVDVVYDGVPEDERY